MTTLLNWTGPGFAWLLRVSGQAAGLIVFGEQLVCGNGLVLLARADVHLGGGGIVPQQAVTAARNQQRDGNLRIAVRQFEHATLLIEQPVPPLAQAVDALAVKRGKAGFGVIEVATDGLERARRRIIRPRENFLDERLVIAGFEKPHPASGVHLNGQSSVDYFGVVAGNSDFGRR